MSNLKTYDCNNKTQLTKNINVKELKCKGSGHIHNTTIDLDHINNVQAFMDKNGYNKVRFSCGYRCKEHNKKIGGSTNSQHTITTATDQCFYKDGKIVSAKEVCCKAQDFGFKGVAYIDKNYVHLDNRASGTYRGDETKGNSYCIPNGDFYAYFGIARDNNTTTTYNLTRPLKKGCKGTDVKELQLRLVELGYSIGKYGVDSSFGPDVQTAVKKFQKNSGISQDGNVGPDTAHKLEWTYKGK